MLVLGTKLAGLILANNYLSNEKNLLPFMEGKALYDPDIELSPEMNGSSSHPSILLLSGPLQRYLPPVPRAFRRALLFRISNQNSCCISHCFHECYMPDTSHTK
jgi:hypothetical protein